MSRENRPQIATIDGRVSRLPSLDGIRGVAIVLVLLGHLNGTAGFGYQPIIRAAGDVPLLGVRLFFIISGFLITTMLVNEWDRSGTVSLMSFLTGRASRIVPPSLLYVLVVSAASLIGIVSVTTNDLVHALSYTMNHAVDRSWIVGHLWSLSVEQQFYLLWPIALLAAGRRQVLRVAVGFIVLGAVARLFARVVLQGTPYADLEMLPMVVDAFAAGSVLVFAGQRLLKNELYRRLLQPMSCFVVLAGILVINRFIGYALVDVFGLSAISLALALLLHRSMLYPTDFVGRLLNSRFLVELGAMSYSLYLWQQPFLNRHATGWFTTFPQNLAAALLTGVAFYRFVERPLLALRERRKQARGAMRIVTANASPFTLAHGVAARTEAQ